MSKALLVDLGEVLVGADHERFINSFVRQTGVSADRLRSVIYESSLHTDFSLGRIDAEAFWSEVCEGLGARLSPGFFFALWNETISELPGVGSLMERLAEEHELYLLSNTDPVHLKFVLERQSHWMKLFRGFFLSYEESVLKPEPRFFQMALARFSLSAKDCVFFDDRQENVEAADMCGISSVLVRNRTLDMECLQLAGIDLSC